MIDAPAPTAETRIKQTTRLVSEIRAMVQQTQRTVAASKAILAAQRSRQSLPGVPSVVPARIAPPDALCAAFDALLEAAHQAEKTDDPELFALIERALLHAGARIEQTAAILARREPPVH